METEPFLKPLAQPNIVPNWFYIRDEDVCCITKAAFLWWANFVAMIFHIGLAVVSVLISIQGGTKTMATPRLSVYLTDLTWNPNSTDALVPTNVPVEGLYLSWLTLSFFALSAAAHGTVVLFNFKQAFALNEKRERDDDKAKITPLTGWYYLWIHECRNPARWIEYSFSASIMAIVFAVAGGVNHLYMIISIFTLIWCTMVFGHVAEIVNRPFTKPNDTDSKPQYWQINRSNPGLMWLPRLGPKFNRLWYHILGYVPFLVSWFIILHSFLYAMSTAEQRAPDFVYVIIFSQCAIFSVFGITQFVVLWLDKGPAYFFAGEVSYIILSLTAKGVLGAILMYSVLAYDSFEESVAAAS